MRGRGRSATAALAAALALAATSCSDLVSSLTPFGLGDRGQDAGESTYSGSWKGGTSSGGTITFSVVGDEVRAVELTHESATCTTTFSIGEGTPALIDSDAFFAETPLDPQGRFAISGRFTSPEAATGTYSFDSTAASSKCPSSGAGSFTAAKQPPVTP